MNTNQILEALSTPDGLKALARQRPAHVDFEDMPPSSRRVFARTSNDWMIDEHHLTWKLDLISSFLLRKASQDSIRVETLIQFASSRWSLHNFGLSSLYGIEGLTSEQRSRIPNHMKAIVPFLVHLELLGFVSLVRESNRISDILLNKPNIKRLGDQLPSTRWLSKHFGKSKVSSTATRTSVKREVLRFEGKKSQVTEEQTPIEPKTPFQLEGVNPESLPHWVLFDSIPLIRLNPPILFSFRDLPRPRESLA